MFATSNEFGVFEFEVAAQAAATWFSVSVTAARTLPDNATTIGFGECDLLVYLMP